MKNVIRNIVTGQGDGNSSGFEYARKLADENQQKTGNKTTVTRVLDYADIYNNERREHFSFDVTEIIDD